MTCFPNGHTSRRSALFLVIAIFVIGISSPAFAQERTLSGKVFDAEGKGVAGASVATFWESGDSNGELGKMRPYSGVVTGDDGAFSLKAQFYAPSQAVMCIDADQKRGAIVAVEAKDADAPLTLTLQPLIGVEGKMTCSELGKSPEWMNVYASLMPGRLRIAQCTTKSAAFSMKLPPGQYQTYFYGSGVYGATREIAFAKDNPRIDFGAIDFKPTGIAKFTGKPAPGWTVTDARGLPKTVQPSDFKGKWLLVEFWGFW